jgi:hypothetical protein
MLLITVTWCTTKIVTWRLLKLLSHPFLGQCNTYNGRMKALCDERPTSKMSPWVTSRVRLRNCRLVRITGLHSMQ